MPSLKNVKPRYGIVDFDTPEIVSMESVSPEIDIFCAIFAVSSHGTSDHFIFFYNGNNFHLKWMFFMIYALSLFFTKCFRFGSAKLLC